MKTIYHKIAGAFEGQGITIRNGEAPVFFSDAAKAIGYPEHRINEMMDATLSRCGKSKVLSYSLDGISFVYLITEVAEEKDYAPQKA